VPRDPALPSAPCPGLAGFRSATEFPHRQCAASTSGQPHRRFWSQGLIVPGALDAVLHNCKHQIMATLPQDQELRLGYRSSVRVTASGAGLSDSRARRWDIRMCRPVREPRVGIDRFCDLGRRRARWPTPEADRATGNTKPSSQLTSCLNELDIAILEEPASALERS